MLRRIRVCDRCRFEDEDGQPQWGRRPETREDFCPTCNDEYKALVSEWDDKWREAFSNFMESK